MYPDITASRRSGRDFYFMDISEDNFRFALENTEVLLGPNQRIRTFGTTHFEFHLITELMDEVNVVRVRNGRVDAERPQILTMDHLHRLALEGFGEKAGEFAEWMQESHPEMALLKYGFQVRKTELSEELVHDPVEVVSGRIVEQVRAADQGNSVVIRGVDEGWEVSLLKFTADLINESVRGNVNEWRRNGLI